MIFNMGSGWARASREGFEGGGMGREGGREGVDCLPLCAYRPLGLMAVNMHGQVGRFRDRGRGWGGSDAGEVFSQIPGSFSTLSSLHLTRFTCSTLHNSSVIPESKYLYSSENSVMLRSMTTLQVWKDRV